MNNFAKEPKDGDFIKYIESINKEALNTLKQDIINENIGKDSLQKKINDANQYINNEKHIDKNSLQKKTNNTNQYKNNEKHIDKNSLQKKTNNTTQYKNPKEDEDIIVIDISDSETRQKIRKNNKRKFAQNAKEENEITSKKGSKIIDVILQFIILVSIGLAYITEANIFIAIIFISSLIFAIRSMTKHE